MSEDETEKFTPRPYQVELTKIGLKQNTIIFLPTGSGKTYIGLLILKQMSGSLLKPYDQGGKITVILVNTVALVDQHAKYINEHTSLKVGCYSGELNLDFWPRDKWYDELRKFQVYIMTCQILVNLVNSNYIDLNNVNLLIFDECHRGVNDHSMRQLMTKFKDVQDQPRVLGLTATLLNGNCKPGKVMEQVKALEVTYHSKVATVDGLEHIVGYSTNPQEEFKFFEEYHLSIVEEIAINHLKNVTEILKVIKIDSCQQIQTLPNLKRLETDEGLNKLKNLVNDQIDQINVMGTYGGLKACLAHMIQIERLKKHCVDIDLYNILNYVVSIFAFVKVLLTNAMNGYNEKEKIYKFSSPQVCQLIAIFEEYKQKSSEELCGLIFTQRRFTAKILHHLLESLSKVDSKFSHIRSNFVVGNNNNPYKDTRESLYIRKKNRQIIESFAHKEINIMCASNVLEEGVDIPKCTLVVKFDKPMDYRAYIQSKGRARHKSSLFYMMISKKDYVDYIKRYTEFQAVEKTLNEFLIGKNESRKEPSPEDIEALYNEDEIPPYYANGPGSAQVNLQSAIPLLCQYCQSLPCDQYTIYAPEWYIQKREEDSKCSVVIILPTISPVLDIVVGPYMSNKKIAKRAAALKACELLHKCGEFDDHLLPRKTEVKEEDVSFLFAHYPEVKEKAAGTKKNMRVYNKLTPQTLKGQLVPHEKMYLHVIELHPEFARNEEDINHSTVYDAYTSALCFGLISVHPLMTICDFPIYVTMGTINVHLKVNKKTITLRKDDIRSIREFNYLVFKDILQILKPFLAFDNSNEAGMLLLVPINKNTTQIDFEILKNKKSVKDVSLKPSADERMAVEVTQETYLRKIVSPWYRGGDNSTYIVTEVCLNLTPLSEFPSQDFSTFEEYYKEKHNIKIVNRSQPLLLVKGLTKRLNMMKPRGKIVKKKRDKSYEELEEHLLPELLVKQDIPSALWIQASFLPSILTRVIFLQILEELRIKIAQEITLRKLEVYNHIPLMLDEHLLNYEPLQEDSSHQENVKIDCSVALALPSSSWMNDHCNKDFANKMLENEFPWKDIDEPKDIERELNITSVDIEYFEQFINGPVNSVERTLKNDSPKKSVPALTYYKEFVPKNIALLDKTFNHEGPELCEIYRAFTTAKANDIVNLERLETLGDSYLKLLATLYVIFRFPQYDEGRSTIVKCRMISNKNLYYLAQRKNFGNILRNSDLFPREEGWLPPGFNVPHSLKQRVANKELSINALFNFTLSDEEQISGQLSEETAMRISKENYPVEENEESSYSSMYQFLRGQYIGDKTIADVAEAMLGVYFQSCGFKGAIKFVEWLGIIPASEHFEALLNEPPPSPLIGGNANLDIANLNRHLPCWRAIESQLGYQFKDKAYMLQAFTHSSYSLQRLTRSYEKLEFMGDAVLDFLITCHIFESCGYLTPGDLTDLRSALVNNNTFASLLVRNDFHKHILLINSQLQSFIDKFADYLAKKNYEIDDEVLILIEEDDQKIAEYVDVPKVLGDVFEALAGAIYLDSGKNLKTVWNVFYKIMWKEIDLFSQNVPKNVVRRLHETPGLHPTFGNATDAGNGKTMVQLNFMSNGRLKLAHGFGSNKFMAKKAAAKIALRSLEK